MDDTSAANPAPPLAQSSTSDHERRYFVRFEGNQSKRWDGKEIELNSEWLDSLYSAEELAPGCKLTLPWPGKGKKVNHWNVVVVDPKTKSTKEKKVQASNERVDKPSDGGKVKKRRLSQAKTPKKKPGTQERKGKIIRVGSSSCTPGGQDTINDSGTGLGASPGHGLPSTDITQLVQQQDKIGSLLTTQVEQRSLPMLHLTPLGASLPPVSQQQLVLSPQPSSSASLTPSQQQHTVLSAQASSSGSLPPVPWQQSMHSLQPSPSASLTSVPQQDTVFSPQASSSTSLPPVPRQQSMHSPQPSQSPSFTPAPQQLSRSFPQAAFGVAPPTVPQQQSMHSLQPSPSASLTPVPQQLSRFSPQASLSVAIPPVPEQQSVHSLEPSLSATLTAVPQQRSTVPPQPPSAITPPAPQQHSIISPQQQQPQSFHRSQDQFIQPSALPPSLTRRQDDICIDDLLSDDYNWNDSDSDYLTSSTFSELEASGSSSGSSHTCASGSRGIAHIPPPPFSTPPKLSPVENVMKNNPGTDIASLRSLTTALARDAIFGRDELAKSSLSGRNHTGTLSNEKLTYIKTLVQSRVPNKSAVEFEHICSLCRSSLSKSCQTLRSSAKKKL